MHQEPLLVCFEQSLPGPAIQDTGALQQQKTMTHPAQTVPAQNRTFSAPQLTNSNTAMPGASNHLAHSPSTGMPNLQPPLHASTAPSQPTPQQQAMTPPTTTNQQQNAQALLIQAQIQDVLTGKRTPQDVAKIMQDLLSVQQQQMQNATQAWWPQHTPATHTNPASQQIQHHIQSMQVPQPAQQPEPALLPSDSTWVQAGQTVVDFGKFKRGTSTGEGKHTWLSLTIHQQKYADQQAAAPFTRGGDSYQAWSLWMQRQSLTATRWIQWARSRHEANKDANAPPPHTPVLLATAQSASTPNANRQQFTEVPHLGGTTAATLLPLNMQHAMHAGQATQQGHTPDIAGLATLVSRVQGHQPVAAHSPSHVLATPTQMQLPSVTAISAKDAQRAAKGPRKAVTHEEQMEAYQRQHKQRRQQGPSTPQQPQPATVQWDQIVHRVVQAAPPRLILKEHQQVTTQSTRSPADGPEQTERQQAVRLHHSECNLMYCARPRMVDGTRERPFCCDQHTADAASGFPTKPPASGFPTKPTTDTGSPAPTYAKQRDNVRKRPRPVDPLRAELTPLGQAHKDDSKPLDAMATQILQHLPDSESKRALRELLHQHQVQHHKAEDAQRELKKVKSSARAKQSQQSPPRPQTAPLWPREQPSPHHAWERQLTQQRSQQSRQNVNQQLDFSNFPAPRDRPHEQHTDHHRAHRHSPAQASAQRRTTSNQRDQHSHHSNPTQAPAPRSSNYQRRQHPHPYPFHASAHAPNRRD